MYIHHLAITLIIFLITVSATHVYARDQALHVELAISFDIEEHLLFGTAKIAVPAGQSLPLNLLNLKVTGSVLSTPGKENQEIALTNQSSLLLHKSPEERTLYISYEKHFQKSFKNNISKEAIILTSAWHPIPGRKAVYSLIASVPPGFTAVTESDIFNSTDPDGNARFHFSQPVHTITFAAAPYIKQTKEVRTGLYVHTLFFPEEQQLAEEYLNAATTYIRRYEEKIGPFPYNHYLIVENTMPTGFGIPTFTLLGKQVLRLPFIKDISLGHEILHSWFGNSVEPDHDSGNWCEGLTTYLADMAYRTDTGDGPPSRKEKIQEYLSYVTDTTQPLKDFVSAGHTHQPDSRAERAVGYGRAAMLFHELENRVGSIAFNNALQTFYNRFKGKTASWTDIQHLFEQESGLDLQTFFNDRLNRNDLPDLSISDLRVKHNSESHQVSFTLEQNNEKPNDIFLPFTVHTTSGDTRFTKLISNKTTKISVPAASLPLELIIDPDYNVMRTLSKNELFPSWSQIMGKSDVLVILADENSKEIYTPFIDMASLFSWQTAHAADLTEKDIENKNLIFLGTCNLYRGLFGSPDHNESGFTLEIRNHPIHPDNIIAMVTSSGNAETAAVVSRLSHYGKYSYLYFSKGRITERHITSSDNGIRIPIESKPHGFSLSQISDFDNLATALGQNRVVYAGENHTSRSDHLLQLMLIEALYKQNPNLAIGMEMFPRSSQNAIDSYILKGEIDETAFIKQSRYYDVWRFDYRLFRPIFSFAKKHHIPVIGLNIDRETVSSVYKKGGIAYLDPQKKAELPIDRNLDMDGYTERLRNVHTMHSKMSNTDGPLTGFIESQALWDEFMAESISTYLNHRPTVKLIVLAGSQHTRKDSGIPPRVARRINIRQASVINLSTNSLSGKELKETTDFAFFLESSDFPPQGKIGVVLQATNDTAPLGLEITEIAPSSHAVSAGIHIKDILTGINGHRVMDMEDVRISMLDKSVGEIISIMVKRKNSAGIWEERTFQVELFSPKLQMVHP